ncbi:MAG: RNA polymerase factor sigma-54, partial [Phycisphaerae bacterium]|nr:RNA polymerase factor sigma-54 [Phycisphaerae bacterium]
AAPAPAEDYAEDRGEHPLVVDEKGGNSEDFRRLAEFEDEYGAEFVRSDTPPRPRPVATGERDRKMDAMANAPAPGQSLNEYLLEQWRFVEAAADIKAAGELVINHIDDDGYLRTPLEELSHRGNPPHVAATLQAAHELVKALEPPGIGARDLKECLLLQLAAEAEAGRDVALEMELVERFLRDIEMNHLPQIAKRTDRPLDEITAAIGNLSRLNPRPGSIIGERTVPVIMPDVIVGLTAGGEVVIQMTDGSTPRLQVSESYRNMSKNRKTDMNTRQYIRKNMRSAEWLISAIEQRRKTVRRVSEEIFKVQREFLESGPEALKPLPMAKVAKKVGVHVATVSRAVAGKFVQTPRGIYPLRMFFSGGTRTADGEDVAWDAVKVKLKEIVNAEDKSKPLNDDRLAVELKKHGIDIARRTVAKYRGLLNIPPARKRRQY